MTFTPETADGRPADRPTSPGTAEGGRFRAPHRRAASGPRLREKAVVAGYVASSWVLGRLPFGPTVRVGGWLSDVVYAAWPEKRRFVRANAGRILGVPPDDRRAVALGRAVFRNQVRWVIEGMHLARMTRDQHAALFDGRVEDLRAVWEASNGMILAGLHIGNSEVAGAAIARLGMPFWALADDTAYDELFERMAAQRRAWGIDVIRWRNLRDVYRVLRNREILGLLVDWGYRADGQPVRFLGAWTTLPSGPAVLAARTGATIVPFWTIRRADGTYHGDMGEPVVVRSTDPAEIARATQAIADALEPAVREAPEQWCVFKPMWPPDAAAEAELAERMAASAPAPGPAAPNANPAGERRAGAGASPGPETAGKAL